MTNKLTSLEVSELIDNFTSDKSAPYEWDDFISVSFSDPALEEIRRRCANLITEFPPDKAGSFCNENGIQVLKNMAQQLKHKVT